MKEKKQDNKQRTTKKQLPTLVLTIIMFLFMMSMVQATITIDKTEYEKGEQITFFVDTKETNNLEIIHPERVFRLVGNPNGEHKFYPENGGEYLIQIIANNNEVIETQTFTVKEKYTIIQNEYFTTNKKEYKPGEAVIITLLKDVEVERVRIKYQDIEYSFMGKPEFPLNFYPDKIGTYTIILEDTNNNLYETSFETKIITTHLEHPFLGSSTKPIRTMNSKGQILDMKIKYEETIPLTRGTAIKEIEEQELERNKKYDVEIKTKNEKQRINIKGFNYQENTNLGFEEIRNKKINQINSNIISIKTEFEFEEITIKNTALGTELLRCEGWNFEGQSCEGTWIKIQDITPGEEYEITIIEGTTNAYAETGVASINTKKSIYKPEETAEIIMVVLDKDGYLVPGAEITLNVTTPNNENHTYTTNNGTITGGEQGVYYANHITEEEGRYELSVSAKARNVDDSMKSYFIVLNDYEFDIVRETPVTIDPYQGPFESRIKITSLKNLTITSFTEVLPSMFKVQNAEGATITEDEKKIYLTWNNVENNTELKYSFNSPFIIPYLWEQGPSIITYEELGETKTFTEARPWYLAIDPITYYDPTSDITTQWSSGTGISYTEIVKTARQPTTPTVTTYISSESQSTDISEFGFSSVTETGVEKINLWVYTTTGSNAQYTFSLRRDGNTLCSNTVPTNTLEEWINCTWTPSGDLSSLSVHFSEVPKIGGGRNTFATVYAAYLEVDTGTPPPSVTLNAPTTNAIMTSTPVNFNFTVTDETYNTVTCRLYTNTTGTWEVTTTLNNVNTNTLTNTQLSPSDGEYIWNVECENADLKSAFAENNRTVYVNVNAPLIENEALNETTIRQNRTVRFNATITDSFGISTAKITVRYPNSSIIEHELQNNGNEYYYEFTNTLEEGIYNVTKIWTNDTLGQSNEKNTNLYFEVQVIPPTEFNLLTPLNSTESRELTPTMTWEETTTPDFDNYTLILDKDPAFGSPDYIYSTHTITNTSYTLGFALDANNVYYWKVIAYDVFGNFKESTNSFKYINDRTNPTVTLNNPINNYYTAIQEVTFSYTPNDANTIDYCELLTNETETMEVRQTNNTITKNQLNYFTHTLPEGITTWNVQCHDNATNQGSGTARQLTVDITGPVVTLISPENDTLINDTNLITFIATAYDELSNTDYCELIVNGTIRETNTEITDNVNFNFSTFLNNNYYEWNVKCYDDLGNDATSTTNYLTVESLDNDPPIITLIQPTQNKYINASTVFFEYLVEDATGIENCSIYIDNEFKEENTNIINFENNNFTILGISEDIHNWSVTCTDNSSENNIGNSNTRIFTVDLTNPIVTLNTPVNDSFLNYSNINYVYTPFDENLYQCYLYTNITGNFEETSTHTTPTKNEENTFNVNTPSGTFAWNVLCLDLSGRQNFATNNYTLSVDIEAPKYSNIIVSPATPVNYAERTYWFNITWIDNFEIDKVILEHNFTGSVSKQELIGTNNVYNYSMQNLNAGTYYYKWVANDTSSNENETMTYTYVVNKATPIINLYLNNTQNNLSIDENNNVLIEGEVITPSNGYIEIRLNNELISSGTGSISNNYYFDEPGTYNVTLIYNETTNYVYEQKTFFVLVNDVSPPLINLISPSNDTLLSSGTRNFVYRVNDSSNVESCELYINNTLNQTSTNIQKNIDQSFSANIEPGSYNWRIDCTDEHNNLGTSETRTFTAVDDNDININIETTKPEYEDGETARIKINTTDAFGNALQTQITNHIIKGNTTTPWWNISWKKRKQLQINETTGTIQNNALIGINITFNEAISCVDELRIIKQETTGKEETPYKIYEMNNTWCYVAFYADLGANEENNNYYAYYNNSEANNPNYVVDVMTNTLFNAQEAATDIGTVIGVTNIIGKNDATNAEMTQGGGGGTHAGHGRAFINETFGPIEKVEISYRYEVPDSSGTWSLRYSVNDGTDYSSIHSGTTIQAKQTSAWGDITNIYSALTWNELNRTRLQGHVTKSGGGSITMYLYWVEMNVTHYKGPDVIGKTNLEEEKILKTEIETTSTNGYFEATWNTHQEEQTTYSSVVTASAETYNDATSSTTFNVTPDATPPNITLISPENWFESGKGFFNFEYKPFDYNLDNCTLYIGPYNETMGAEVTNTTPVNNETNVFENVYVNIGIYEWNVLCFDTYNNSAFAPENYVLNISAPDLLVTSEDIWFEYTQLIEGTQINVYANITNEGLSSADNPFIVQFYLGDPELGGTHIANVTINELQSLETKTINTTHTLITGPNNIYVIIDSNNDIEEADITNNKANNTINVELYHYYYGSSKTDIILAHADKSLFVQYPNLTDRKGYIFFADADAEFSFGNLQALTRNTDGNLVAGDFEALDIVMETTNYEDSIKQVWGGGTETPLETKTFNLSSGAIYNTPIVPSTDYQEFVTGILWDTSGDTGNQRYDSVDKETIIFVTEINPARQGRFGTYDFEIKVPATLREYSGETNKLSFYLEIN